MTIKINKIVKINSILFILILFGLTFLIIPSDKTKMNPFRIDKHPQEYMKAIFIQNFTELGNLKTQVAASYWAYTPETAASTFSDPRLITYRPDGTQWRIRAEKGQTKQPKIGSIEEIELSENVIIERPTFAKAKAEAITVNTENLCYHPKKEFAESNAFIKMVKPGLEISGIGLRAYLNKNRVELLDQVETYFHANTKQENPVTIHSKQAAFDEKNNKVTYQGEVIMTQNTNQITSDVLIIEKDDNGKIESMIALGKPAYFKSETNPSNPASGQAEEVNYVPKQQKIYFSQEAVLTQNNNTIQAPELSYDLNSEILSSHPVKGQRTTVILQPKPKQGSSAL